MKVSRFFLVLLVFLLGSVSLAQAIGPLVEFKEVQSILTAGAQDWEYFAIGSNHYLAVANGYNGSTNNIDSKIYKWDGATFAEFQSIPTNNAHHWEYFTMN